MSVYFIPLFTLPDIIDAPGEYLTRGGDRVMIDCASTRHNYGCVGSYLVCGTAEKWHKSGRILATSETRNDIVCKAPCEAAATSPPELSQCRLLGSGGNGQRAAAGSAR